MAKRGSTTLSAATAQKKSMKCRSIKKRPAARPDTPVPQKKNKAGSHVMRLRRSASLGSVSPLFYHQGVRHALRKSDVESLMLKVVTQYQP